MALQLSPGIVYHIRKLLRQNLDRLQFTQPGGLPADVNSDLSAILMTLYGSSEKVHQVVDDLDRLTIVHQALSSNSVINRPDLQKTEDQIFTLLGFEARESVESRGLVLIVDDVMANVNLLAAALRRQDYDVQTANSGPMALALAQNQRPDLLLLDIMMPEMDGFAVCAQMQNQAQLRDVPIIFVSAVHDAQSKVKAFEMGAMDYIMKPFQMQEVLVRVAHQIKLSLLQKRLEAQNARLQELGISL